MRFVIASCCGMPAPTLPDDIRPWMSITVVCGILLLGEAGIWLWRLRDSAQKSWLRFRVVIPGILGALALAATALDWSSVSALNAAKPDAWHLAFQQRVPGDWFDQLDTTLHTAGYLGMLAILLTIVSLAVGAVLFLADE